MRDVETFDVLPFDYPALEHHHLAVLGVHGPMEADDRADALERLTGLIFMVRPAATTERANG